MVHEVCGTAHYNGKDPEVIKEFGRFKDTELYNCEGWYVLDSEGNQVVIDNDWSKRIDRVNPYLNGKDIDRVYCHHENVVVVDKDEVAYFLSPFDLKLILKKVKFDTEKKRTRIWISKSPKR